MTLTGFENELSYFETCLANLCEQVVSRNVMVTIYCVTEQAVDKASYAAALQTHLYLHIRGGVSCNILATKFV